MCDNFAVISCYGCIFVLNFACEVIKRHKKTTRRNLKTGRRVCNSKTSLRNVWTISAQT